jgi:hypothetical protein
MCSVTVAGLCHDPDEPQTCSSNSVREKTRRGADTSRARRSNSSGVVSTT